MKDSLKEWKLYIKNTNLYLNIASEIDFCYRIHFHLQNYLKLL